MQDAPTHPSTEAQDAPAADLSASGEESAPSEEPVSPEESISQQPPVSQEDPTVPLAAPDPVSPSAEPAAPAAVSSAAVPSASAYQQQNPPVSQPATGTDQGNYGQQPQNLPGSAPATKKPFYASTGGIITIIGAALVLILGIIIAGVVLTYISSNRSASSDSYSSDSSDSSSGSDSGSSSDETAPSDTTDDFVAPAESDNKEPEGDFREYTGSGNETIEIEKPGGADKSAYVTYEFVGKDKYSSIDFNSYDANGKMTGLIDYVSVNKSSGSYWLDEPYNADDIPSPWSAAFSSAAAFVAGALLPTLLILLLPASIRIPATFAGTLLALTITGTLDAQWGGSPKYVRAAARVVVGGTLALGATWLIGTLLGTRSIA